MYVNIYIGNELVLCLKENNSRWNHWTVEKNKRYKKDKYVVYKRL